MVDFLGQSIIIVIEFFFIYLFQIIYMIIDSSSIWFVIQTIIAITIAGIFIIFTFLLFLTIWDFIQSQWNFHTIKQWWNRIRFMTITVIMTIWFLSFLPLFIQYIGVNDYNLFSAQSIFIRIGDLINQLFIILSDFRIS